MKRFNGRKMSHGANTRPAADQYKCPICNGTMLRFRGAVQCTELATSGKKGNKNQVRTIKHGSLKTIRKRLKKRGSSQ